MIERILLLLAKTPDWLVWLLFTSAMTVAATAVLPNVLFLGLLYFPCFLFLTAISKTESLVARLAAHRTIVNFGIVFLGVALCATLHFYDLPPPAEVLVSSDSLAFEADPQTNGWFSLSTGLIVFLVIGGTIGAVLRNVTSKLLDLTVLGRKRLSQSILLTAAWTTGILVFPWADSHREVAPWYVGGIVCGIFISKSFRLVLARTTARFRRIHEIIDAFPKGIDSSGEEREALELLARGRQLPFLRFKKLRKKLENWRGTPAFSNRVALISSALFRIEGDHNGAIVEAEIAKDPPESLPDLHLFLLKALSLFEIESESRGDEIVAAIIDTDIGKGCPLATATSALRAAEKLLDPEKSVQPDVEPLQLIQQALQLRQDILSKRYRNGLDPKDELDLIVVRYTEIGVPLTAPFMLDILGYCIVAAGFPEEGRIILEKCIKLDRSYASAYLHLGDYFFFRRKFSGSDKTTKHEEWHASACYYTALYLEGKSPSHVSRRALKRLENIGHKLK